MPGLFDNSDNSGGIGGILGGLGATLFPGVRNYQLQQRQFGLMQNQYDALMRQPNMTPDRAMAIVMDPNGAAAATQYGMKQFEGPTYSPDAYKPPGPIYSGGQFINAPNSSQQPQPTQQPAGGQPGVPQDVQQAAPIMDFLAQQKARGLAAAKAAEQTATAQPDLPVIQTRAQGLIERLQKIRDNPELPNIVGGPLGVKGRLGPLGQGQSDLLSDIQDANNALQGDLFTSMRTISSGGRAPSIGAMKEMRITDLNARTGTVQAYKDNIDRTIKQVQSEYEAAWKARNSPNAYKPNWQQSAQPQTQIPPQAAAFLKANPHLRSQFDTKYGNGAALSVLGQ